MRRKNRKHHRKIGKNVPLMGIGNGRRRRKRYTVNELLKGVSRKKMQILKAATASVMEGVAVGKELG